MTNRILGLLAAALLATPIAANAASLSYALAVTDEGDPSAFGFAFSSLITPSLTGLNSFSFSGTISMKDGGTDGVSASPSGLPEFWRLEVFNGGWSTVGDVGGTAMLSGAGPFNFTASGMFDCSAIGCSQLRITTNFLLSGRSDQLFSSGTFTLAPPSVPEPGTLALLGLGLAGLGFSRRRKIH